MKLLDEAGRTIVLGTEVATGGEGRILDVVGNNDRLAKLYQLQLSPAKEAKLRRQVSWCPESVRSFAAWPERLLFTPDSRRLVGFLMPRVSGRPIHQLYRPRDRRSHFPKATWQFFQHVAKNLCAAFATLHEHAVFMADVNESNIMVGTDGMVRFIDCDSFQIPRACYAL